MRIARIATALLLATATSIPILTGCGAATTAQTPAATTTTSVQSSITVAGVEPLTGAIVAGCTPLTASGTDELLSASYQTSGTWYAVPGIGGIGYVIGGVAIPFPTGKLEMAAYTVPSLDAAGFTAVRALNNAADIALGVADPSSVMDPVRSQGTTAAQLNSILAVPFTALQRCQAGKSAEPAPYPCSAFYEGMVDGSPADVNDPQGWAWSLTLRPEGSEDAATVAGWQQTVRTNCPEYTAHIDAAAVKFAENRQQAADSAVKAAESAARAATQQALVDSGLRVAPGNHVIGSPMQPGTWQTVVDGVTDCYWEITDSVGNIMDNDFVTFAPGRVTVDIPSDAAGFTNTRCEFERIG